MSTRNRRRGRRSWQQNATCAGIAVLLGADTIGVAVLAYRTETVALYVAAMALSLAAFLLALTAGAWVTSAGWHAARDKHLDQAAARYSPPEPPLYEARHKDQTATAEAETEAAGAVEPELVDVIGADHWCWDGAPPPAAARDPRPWMPPVSTTAAANEPAL